MKTLSDRDQLFKKTSLSFVWCVWQYKPSCGVKDQVIPYGYQPKDEIDRILPTILLLLGNDQPDSQLVIHGKLYAYMAARRPVLALVNKHGDMSKLIKEYKLGAVFYTEIDDYSLDRKPFEDYKAGTVTFGHARSKLLERKTNRDPHLLLNQLQS